MITNKRLLEIRGDLDSFPYFCAEVMRALPTEHEQLSLDLAAAPEFFEEIKDIVRELMEYRHLTEYKRELRAIIPELSNSWVKRKGGIFRNAWKDIMDVVNG